MSKDEATGCHFQHQVLAAPCGRGATNPEQEIPMSEIALTPPLVFGHGTHTLQNLCFSNDETRPNL